MAQALVAEQEAKVAEEAQRKLVADDSSSSTAGTQVSPLRKPAFAASSPMGAWRRVTST